MKKPILLFAVKISVILYFAACTGIDKYTTSLSATPHFTNGAWKVNLLTESETDETACFKGYAFTFDPTGKLTAAGQGKIITGNWAEDNILKRITINLHTNDPALVKLNTYWTISDVSNARLSFQNTEKSLEGRLQLTGL